MGVSAAIFESAGQRTEHYVPGVYSRSNNVSSPSGVSAGNHVILAKSTGGQPFELLSFGSLSDAKETLVGGDLLKAIGYAFKGSNTYVPQTVYAMRVGQATQSELTLKSGSLNILKLKSWDWGVHCNQLKMRVESGSVDNSKTIHVVYKDKSYDVEDIIREAISIAYIGTGTNPICTITTTGMTLSATVEGSAETTEISWDDVSTLSELEIRINDTGLYTASVLDSETDRAVTELDTVSTVSLTDGKVFYSNLSAFIEALESIPYIGSVELLSTSSRVVPGNDSNFVYFTGGTASTPTTEDWDAALTALETEDIQIISTPSTDSNVLSLIATHCATMSNTVNRKERTCILGAAIGETDDNAITAAKGFNSKYVSYVIDSAIATNPLSGDTETISGAYLGVMLAGMESAMAVNEPLTFKTLNVLGFSKKRTNTNMEKLIKNGLIVCQPNPENMSECVCIRGLTTYQGSGDLISCERSMVREDLYMNRDLRNRFIGGIGHPNGGSTSDAISTLKQAAKDWGVAGYIVKGDDWVWDISASVSGDKVYITFSRYLTAPRNFVFITATNKVYSSTVEI